ncbi:MAG: GNAT family N-acetyltransferase [Candidatus Hydrogenedentes bacterium]|nr:GNAT family N-acetyltransferase [Candidatus Hydrogenedentota bacterium]
MIKTTHGHIRIADPDDAPFLHGFYDMKTPRAALLDTRREPLMPAVAELRELLGRKEAMQGLFYAIEDDTGAVRGFCSLRGMNQEASFGEVTLLLDDAGYEAPLADEALSFLLARAFTNLRLNKLMAHSLTLETRWRDFLKRHGFEDAGTLRECFFGGGQWHDIHLYTLVPAAPAVRN